MEGHEMGEMAEAEWPLGGVGEGSNQGGSSGGSENGWFLNIFDKKSQQAVNELDIRCDQKKKHN